MDSSNSKPAAEVAQDVSPMFKIYEDGRVERLIGNEIVPPSFDPKTSVDSKDVIAVSVDHRRAPENLVPCAHEDSWAALKWVASHADGQGPEDWLNHYADFERVFYLWGQRWRASIEKMWRAACPGTSGCDDPLINPFVGSTLANLGCKRVQVHVAEKDLMRDRGWFYYEKLKESGWGGEAEIVESKGEPHIFYLLNPTCDSAVAMRKKIASFFNEI
ncbi:putative carboxylesterase 12 [Citrus sinensis]|uniref:Carboxylesterase 12 n=1 Tax=Citrus sinensis TaxID=2711 RepID=A0ACB8IF65_CITSI|nr:putative carboxylesterase 12 [Citrus sinensis]